MKAALIAIVLAGCAAKPPEILGARMPHGCTTKNASTDERCLGWLMNRVWMVTALRPYRDADLTAYVSSVGERLVRAHGDKREWTFAILDNDADNAYAGIGTHIYINRGILARLRSEDELAAVLGHEIGHSLGGHTHSAFITSQTWREKRDDEIQADETGVMLLAEAGYDATAMSRMLRALAAAELGQGALEEEDAQSGYPPWFERITRAEIVAASHAGPVRVTGGDERFSRAMATLVVGVDPHDHVMTGTVAMFPHIGVAIDVPEATKVESTVRELQFSAFAPHYNVVDLRLYEHAVATLMPSTSDAPDVAVVVVPGRRESPYGKELDLVITVKGPEHTDIAKTLAHRARPITRDELASIKPTLVNMDAPRLLWSPLASR